VDLRSNIAAESRAKIVYERLLLFTNDPYVQDTLRFLMTREITHFQQFSAALATISPNFPPGVFQGDLRFTHTAFNMSTGFEEERGPWNEGQGPWPEGEEWEYVEDPALQVKETLGQANKEITGHNRDPVKTKKLEREIAKKLSREAEMPNTEQAWSDYAPPEDEQGE
jgi:Mn-containing catalase